MGRPQLTTTTDASGEYGQSLILTQVTRDNAGVTGESKLEMHSKQPPVSQTQAIHSFLFHSPSPLQPCSQNETKEMIHHSSSVSPSIHTHTHTHLTVLKLASVSST